MVASHSNVGNSPVPRAVDWESNSLGVGECVDDVPAAEFTSFMGADFNVVASPGAVVIIDQTLLPHEVKFLKLTKTADLIEAIRRLAVRGAPAIGVAGAFGVALAFQEYCGRQGRTQAPGTLASSASASEALPPEFQQAVAALRQARPTAVNLARMVDRVVAKAQQGFKAVLEEALKIRDEEIAASKAMGERGAELVCELVGKPKIRAMTICNTGGLATVERGTALAVIQTLHEQGRLAAAIVLETRPLLQGARLTTWELSQMGAPYELVVDSAGPALLAQGGVDVVLTGADRIAANGDTANKIGTFSLALGAQYAGVPLLVVAPESTVDLATPSGQDIEIEDRGPHEVRSIQGKLLSVEGAPTQNPAFDVTPASLITAIVVNRRVIRLDRGEVLDG